MNNNIHKMLAGLKNVKELNSGAWSAYCPIHEAGAGTHNNSLSITDSGDDKILVHCHNGCDSKEIVYAIGMLWSDCFPEKRQSTSSSKITAKYDYLDEDSVLRFQVCRLEPGKDGRKKDFRQRQPDGNGGWTWKTQGLKKFLYRLPELIASKDEPVFIVEGEKQVDYLRSKGLTATTNPGGAGKWLKPFSKWLKNRDCIVVPDADLPNEKTGKIVGNTHAKEVADSLLETAKSVHLIELPNCQPKWGLDDWLENGNTLDNLSQILSETKEWGPDSELITSVTVGDMTPEEMADPMLPHRTMLEDCGITYVAFNEKTNKVEVFSSATQKFSQIANTGNLKYDDLVLAGGLQIIQKVMRNADDTGDYSMSQVKSAIAAVASQNSVVDEKLGVGIWEDNHSLIVVNSRELGILNGKPELDITKSPVQYGTAYNIGDRLDWINLNDLRRDIINVDAKPGMLYVDEVFQMQELFGRWTYAATGHVFPEVLTGMVMATFVQTLWEWRPQVFLTGQSYSGKTTMMKMVAKILGPLCKLSSNSSTAGIRQIIGSSSRIVLCDELEKSRDRTEILEMIRASGRGDDSFRGTAGHTAIAFKLQHIFWCASIESGLTIEADQSRFIVAELLKTADVIDVPSHDALEDLGRKLVVAAIGSVRRAREITTFLLDNKPEDVHGRICESYSVPIAMYAAAIGMSETEALKLFRVALKAISDSEVVESDSESLLHEILTSKVRMAGGSEKSVIHMILDNVRCGHEDELQHAGIYFLNDRVLFNRKLILRYLLPPEWKGRRIDTILMRLRGAERIMKRFGDSVFRFVSIPRSSISEVDLVSDRDAPTFEQQAQNPLLF